MARTFLFCKTNLPTHQYNYWRVNRACKGEKKLFFYLQVPKSPIYPKISICLSYQATMDGWYQPECFRCCLNKLSYPSVSFLEGMKSLKRKNKVPFWLNVPKCQNHLSTPKFKPVCPLKLQWTTIINRSCFICCPNKLSCPPVSFLEGIQNL